MFVETKKIPSKIDRLGRQWYKSINVFSCDECSTKFESGLKRQGKLHFCKRECFRLSAKGGILRSKKEATCLAKYGTTSPLSSSECLKKSRITCLQKYGVETTGQSRISIENRQKTCLKRYGKISFLGTKQCKKRYNDPEIEQRCRDSFKKVDWVKRNTKKFETMKLNNSFKTSKPEEIIHSILIDHFGENDVERQVQINDHWFIDFHVKSIDTYVQYDSYWHGYKSDGTLRDLNEVAEFKSKQDKSIHGKMLIDQRQNEWFKARNMRLIRVICDEYLNIDALISRIT